MRIKDFANADRFYLTDGGLETYMIFEKGYDLPLFAAAHLLESENGRNDLATYYERFIETARNSGRGFVMDTPTWRSGGAWAEALGKSKEDMRQVNTDAVRFLSAIRRKHESASLPILINGQIGPAGDAYAPDTVLSAQEAFDVHGLQVHALGKAGVDTISALTFTHAEEAIGIARCAREIDIPINIGFTLETDGRLPSGQSLNDAIAEVDGATDATPFYYMINCAHPDHFKHILYGSEDWMERIGGVRANASRLSHAELDESETLDDGDPREFGELNAGLLSFLPNIRVLGGCCGTDHRHVGCIAQHT